jgi:hypothetical protein
MSNQVNDLRGNQFMTLRNKLLTGAAALAWAASIGMGVPAAWGSSGQPGLFALAAKGNSFDGFFQQGDTYCDYCDGPECGCFLADSNGGTGSLKFGQFGPTNMGWDIELDYANNDQYDNGNYGSCWPASGEIESFTGAKQRQTVYFDTTGMMCNTGYFNETYTGSYYVTGGYNGYSTTSGAGSVSLSIYSWYNSPVLNSQLQMTGNISRSPKSSEK